MAAEAMVTSPHLRKSSSAFSIPSLSRRKTQPACAFRREKTDPEAASTSRRALATAPFLVRNRPPARRYRCPVPLLADPGSDAMRCASAESCRGLLQPSASDSASLLWCESAARLFRPLTPSHHHARCPHVDAPAQPTICPPASPLPAKVFPGLTPRLTTSGDASIYGPTRSAHRRTPRLRRAEPHRFPRPTAVLRSPDSPAMRQNCLFRFETQPKSFPVPSHSLLAP